MWTNSATLREPFLMLTSEDGVLLKLNYVFSFFVQTSKTPFEFEWTINFWQLFFVYVQVNLKIEEIKKLSQTKLH
jgi:hypothetical protein